MNHIRSSVQTRLQACMCIFMGTTSEFRAHRTRISCIRYRLRKKRAYYKPVTNGQVKSFIESRINEQPYLFVLSLIEIPKAGNNLATTKSLSQDKEQNIMAYLTVFPTCDTFSSINAILNNFQKQHLT